MTSELALKRDGTMLGLKVRVIGNLGAYLNSLSAIPPLRMMAMARVATRSKLLRRGGGGLYHTVPTGPIAARGDRSRCSISSGWSTRRRVNWAWTVWKSGAEFYRRAVPVPDGRNVEYDSGDYEKSLAEALRLSDYDNLILSRRSAQRGELVGGPSTFAEPSGGVGFESATVRVERSGDLRCSPVRAPTARV